MTRVRFDTLAPGDSFRYTAHGQIWRKVDADRASSIGMGRNAETIWTFPPDRLVIPT